MTKIGSSVTTAHATLVPLVKRVASGALPEGEARKQVLQWAMSAALNRSRLSAAAISVLEYELGEEGFEKRRPEGEVAEELKALRRLKAMLFPPEGHGTPGRPVPVEPAPEIRAKWPEARACRLGEVEILARPEAGGWVLTVAHPRRYPVYEELRVATTVVGEDQVFWAHVPGGPASPGVGGYVITLMQDPRKASVG